MAATVIISAYAPVVSVYIDCQFADKREGSTAQFRVCNFQFPYC